MAVMVAGFVLTLGQLHAEEPLPSPEKVRKLLAPGGPLVVLREDGKPIRPDPLLTFGNRLFPTYEAIIADSESDLGVVANALYTICAIKADRKMFLHHAVQRLTDSSFSVRSAALELLGEIGSEHDTAPIVALLSDDDSGVRRKAAKVLAKIGGKNDIVAMDIWSKVGNHRNDGDHVRDVKKYRDELEKRVKSLPKDQQK